MTVHDFDEDGGGLAAERTDLAWNRSGLALLACGAAVLKGFPPTGLSARHVVGLVILVLGGSTWVLGACDSRRRMARVVATPRNLLPVALGTSVVGAAILVLAALYPS